MATTGRLGSSWWKIDAVAKWCLGRYAKVIEETLVEIYKSQESWELSNDLGPIQYHLKLCTHTLWTQDIPWLHFPRELYHDPSPNGCCQLLKTLLVLFHCCCWPFHTMLFIRLWSVIVVVHVKVCTLHRCYTLHRLFNRWGTHTTQSFNKACLIPKSLVLMKINTRAVYHVTLSLSLFSNKKNREKQEKRKKQTNNRNKRKDRGNIGWGDVGNV